MKPPGYETSPVFPPLISYFFIYEMIPTREDSGCMGTCLCLLLVFFLDRGVGGWMICHVVSIVTAPLESDDSVYRIPKIHSIGSEGCTPTSLWKDGFVPRQNHRCWVVKTELSVKRLLILLSYFPPSITHTVLSPHLTNLTCAWQELCHFLSVSGPSWNTRSC